MKQVKFHLPLIALILINSTNVFTQSLQPDANTAGYLKKFRHNYVNSILSKTPENLMEYFADDIRMMPEFQKTMIGKNNALAYYKAFAKRFDVKEYSSNTSETFDIGSRIVEFGSFTVRMVNTNTSQEQVLKGKYFNIWVKEGNVPLKLITEGWNYDHPVKTADEFKFEEVPVVNIAVQSHLPVSNNISFELAALNGLQESVISHHDDRIWAQFYTDDIKFYYSNNPVCNGRKEMDSFLSKHVQELPIFEKLDIRTDRIDELGKYVLEYASHIAIIRAGDYSGVHTGKDIRIWRRENNGSLKIFRGMAMYD